MEKQNEIRHHINTVEQTRKITSAMEMVASTRFKRVMTHIQYNKLYFNKVQRTMKEILISATDIVSPYLIERPEGRCTFIVISGDKGLCGPYNTNVLDHAYNIISEHPNPTLITMGNTAEEYFLDRSMIPDITMTGIVQDPTLTRARGLVREILRLFDSDLTDEIRIIYTSFYGETKNMPQQRRLLPILLTDYGDIRDINVIPEIIYHPSPQKVFEELVPQYVLGILFGVMVQAYASEHYARMTAMHNATTNASDMLKDLKTRYNLARQGAITTEIAEITGAAEALKKGGDQYGEYE